jgi:hypothetical protein
MDEGAIDVLSTLLRENQRKREQRQYHEHAQFKILATVQKAIPGPEILGYGHRENRNCAQAQQREAQPDKQPSRSLAGIKIPIGRIVQFSQNCPTCIRAQTCKFTRSDADPSCSGASRNGMCAGLGVMPTACHIDGHSANRVQPKPT